jgi:hydrogenase nickel incorporation protein HypA/HybF
MHELSVALAILEMADREVGKNPVRRVRELTLEVGVFSGIDVEALEFALTMTFRNTIFEEARVRIIPREGKGSCSQCGNDFPMAEIWTRCPVCNSPAQRIIRGEELRFLSLEVED